MQIEGTEFRNNKICGYIKKMADTTYICKGVGFLKRMCIIDYERARFIIMKKS